jgi:hypothetical protein
VISVASFGSTPLSHSPADCSRHCAARGAWGGAVMTNAPDINSDARGFIAENAAQTAYWADVAREAATIRDDSLLA